MKMTTYPLFVYNKNHVIYQIFRKGESVYIKVDENFRPYFYIEVKNKQKWGELLKKGIGYRTIDGKVAIKHYCEKPSDVPKEREEFLRKGVNVYEADVIYTIRYVIDRYDYNWPKQEYKALFFDIEVEDSLDYINTPKPIISIAFYDAWEKRYWVFVLDRERKYKEGKYKYQDIYVKIFHTEKKLIFNFLEEVKKRNPDLLVAWNIGYDINYLFNRAKRLGLEPEQYLARQFEEWKGWLVKKDETGKIVEFFGRTLIDLMDLYKNMIMKNLPSFSLEYVAEYENLPVKKLERGSVAAKSLKELIVYNKTDVEVMVELDKKLGILDFYDEMRRLVGLAWNQFYNPIIGASRKRLIDVYCLRKAKEKRIVLPTVIERKTEKYPGALVLLPEAKIYKNVIVLDITSMYPNIIRTYNISYETVGKEGEIKVPTRTDLQKLFSKLKHLNSSQREDFLNLIRENREDRLLIKTDHRGLITEIVDELYQRRKHYKKLKKEAKEKGDEEKAREYDLKQLAYKILLNSFYGVMGYPNFRLFKREAAEAVTTFGRALILWIISKVEEKGYRVIYGDTDSVFVWLGDKEKSKEELLQIAKELEEYINKSFDDFAKLWKPSGEHYHQIELKFIFKRIAFFGVKKRYAGYYINEEYEWKEGFEVKGLQVVRSDSAEITREALQKILEMLLKEGKTIEDCLKYIEELKQQIYAGMIPIEKLAFKVTIDPNKEYKNKNVPHLRGLRLALQKKIIDSVVAGKYYYIYIKGLEKVNDVITVPENKVDVLKSFPLDYKRLFDRWFGNIIDLLNRLNGKKVVKYRPLIAV